MKMVVSNGCPPSGFEAGIVGPGAANSGLQSVQSVFRGGRIMHTAIIITWVSSRVFL